MSIKEQVKQLKGMLRVGEAAECLGVTTETLRNWDKSGKLVATRHPVTGYRYYRQLDLDRFLKRIIDDRKKA